MDMTKKIIIILFFIAFIGLTACTNKPYGHYEDDQMIGTISKVDTDKSSLNVDISEWYKRDVRGDIDDYGVEVTVQITDDVVIKNEDDTLANIHHIKIGQKVLVNPPKRKSDREYTANEVILLE